MPFRQRRSENSIFSLVLYYYREKDAKISIYKKTDETYMLKMKNSREFFSAVNKKFGPMPFNLRNFDSETKAKMGVVECCTHKLVVPFQVLYEKEGKNYLANHFN